MCKYIKKINVILIVSILLVACNATQKKKMVMDRNICNTVIECINATKRIVEYNWNKPSNTGSGLRSTVWIELDDTFNAKKVELIKSSGSEEFDRSVILAIKTSLPFVELRGLNQEDYERFRSIKFVFAPDI